jgi:hypothetical protein
VGNFSPTKNRQIATIHGD